MKYLEAKNFFINYLTLNLVSIFFYSGIYYYLLKNSNDNFYFPDAEITADKTGKDKYLNAFEDKYPEGTYSLRNLFFLVFVLFCLVSFFVVIME